ncbi:MAG: ABC transporter permease [Rhodobacterales bacterium]|nr:ABC transporter permease [Rhodobacterales bacterium]
MSTATTTTADTGTAAPPARDKTRDRAAGKERLHARINKAAGFLSVVGLGWITPILKMAAGDSPKSQIGELWRGLGVPLVAILAFLALWGNLAPLVKTSLGEIPGPAQVWEQTVNLYADHQAERAKAAAFYERQEKRNAAKLAKNPDAEVKIRQYTGKPTYIDQILTSLQTVFMGFLIGSLVAVPLGVLCGLSSVVNAAFNPLIQIFKPVSPLAWLPLVTMVVSALYVTDDPMFEKSFLTSAITVTLCSLWPTLINTAVGVASIDKDLMNVGKVLRLSWGNQLTKLVLPSSLPFIFTGLRLSLGVGWMVLIAAEMLAQNPGLGKFVWDEFQNGSSQSLAKIMVAVFTIGVIGFLLDRVMLALQTMFTHQATR